MACAKGAAIGAGQGFVPEGYVPQIDLAVATGQHEEAIARLLPEHG